MLPYWLLFTTFAVGAMGTRPQPGRSPALLIGLAAIAMIFMIGMRYEVGADWRGYQYIFDSTTFLDFSQMVSARGDPGFYTVVWLAHELGLQLWAVNLICAIIFTIGLISLARMQPNPWLAVAVAVPYLVIVVAMSGTRQATAIGFVMMALVALERRHLIRFMVWMGLAASFHASAILLVGIAGLSYTRNRFQTAALVLIIAIPGYFLLSSSFEVYIERYANEELQSEGTIYRVLMNIVPGVLLLLASDRFPAEHHVRLLWRNLALLALLCLPLLAVLPSSTAIDRMALYVIPLQMYVLSRVPQVFARTSGEYYLLLWGVVLYAAAILVVYLGFSVHGAYWVPYKVYPFGY